MVKKGSKGGTGVDLIASGYQQLASPLYLLLFKREEQPDKRDVSSIMFNRNGLSVVDNSKISVGLQPLRAELQLSARGPCMITA